MMHHGQGEPNSQEQLVLVSTESNLPAGIEPAPASPEEFPQPATPRCRACSSSPPASPVRQRHTVRGAWQVGQLPPMFPAAEAKVAEGIGKGLAVLRTAAVEAGKVVAALRKAKEAALQLQLSPSWPVQHRQIRNRTTHPRARTYTPRATVAGMSSKVSKPLCSPSKRGSNWPNARSNGGGQGRRVGHTRGKPGKRTG